MERCGSRCVAAGAPPDRIYAHFGNVTPTGNLRHGPAACRLYRRNVVILAVKTDNPVVELYLLDDQTRVLDRDVSQVGKRLSEELLGRIENLLESGDGSLESITGIIAYRGPGSFTGLRIGLSVTNALAYALGVPIAGATGEAWITEGVSGLETWEPGKSVTAEYGGEANISERRT
ncbi:tRNA (adenosine(37)-N6)-threonylcarbamoyltransferase complex dimerization subunit type 1 TsaB [Candidatus Saccharibacteria bacterium QS_5_54_17]|nr:MAG: tRNA (adenosine(37)-N6)-threonylcarbamoyltransferase complex dimerization subunit type 1 TsaB [Candidatus Saccharibacteria bacterium QS_5_54_17]